MSLNTRLSEARKRLFDKIRELGALTEKPIPAATMFSWIKKLFSAGAPPSPSPSLSDATATAVDEELAGRWYDHKSALMESFLGKEHNMVMHAIIPYAIGGGLDLYYYPHGIEGTGIATKELSDLPDQGSANRLFSCYEMAMFTRHPVNLDDAKNPNTPFGKAHGNINRILNFVAPYSAQATLNGGETCEFPADMEHVGGKCLIFDHYGHHADDLVTSFGVLAILEVFRSEMEFAREQGGGELIARLKAAGHYPYSDLDRAPVA